MVLSLPLMAGVRATVDTDKVMMGEPVTLKLHASGDEVKAPSLSKVCGTKIDSSSQGTSIQAINGNFTKKYTFAYQFTPTADCTIEPIAVTVDGKEEMTEAIAIDVVPMQITSDTPFILQMESEKNEVYVGEPFKVTVTFKQKRNSDVVDSKFAAPDFSGFWTKEQQQSRRFEEGAYTVSRLEFVVAAQQSGKQAINPSQIQIATRTHSRDAWGQWLASLKWRTYFSNALQIDVKPLPEGVTLVGNLTMEAKADRHEIDANEAVNVTLKISGSGNFEDIPSMKPAVPGVAVFAEEADIKAYIENGQYKGGWSQKLAFVGERDFVIPPFTIRYFDPESKRVKTASTAAVPVRVKGSAAAAPKESLTIKRPEPDTARTEKAAAITGSAGLSGSFWMGVLSGASIVLLGMLVPWRRFYGRKEHDTAAGFKDDRRIMMFLLGHPDDQEAKEFAQKLEKFIYSGESADIDRKGLKKTLKRLLNETKSGR